jgi:hypothetical protein
MKMISFTPASIIKQNRRRGSLDGARGGGKKSRHRAKPGGSP